MTHIEVTRQTDRRIEIVIDSARVIITVSEPTQRS